MTRLAVTPPVERMKRAYRLPLIIGIILLANLLLAWTIPTKPVGISADDGIYIGLADSLAASRGMRFDYLPTDPPTATVPVGFPLLLAPLRAIFANQLVPLQIVTGQLMLLTLALLYAYARRLLGDGWAVAVALLFATNPSITTYGVQVMSETPFLLCMVAAVIAVHSAARRQKLSTRNAILLGLLLPLPLLVRYLGLPIYGGLALYLLWHRRQREAVLAIVVSILFVTVVSVGVGGESVVRHVVSTSRQFKPNRSGMWPIEEKLVATGGSLSVVSRDSADVWRTFALPVVRTVSVLHVPLFAGDRFETLLGRYGVGFVPNLMHVGVVLTMVAGGVGLAVRKRDASGWGIVLYAIVLLLVEVAMAGRNQPTRYWLPVVPFGYLFLMNGLRMIRPRKPSLNLLAILFVCGVVALNVGRQVQEIALNPLVERLPDMTVGSEWVRANSAADDVIMVATPRIAHLYLERDVVPYPRGDGAEVLYSQHVGWRKERGTWRTLSSLLDEYAVTHVLIQPQHKLDRPNAYAPYVRDTLIPQIEAHPERFAPVWTSDDGWTTIYEVVPDR